MIPLLIAIMCLLMYHSTTLNHTTHGESQSLPLRGGGGGCEGNLSSSSSITEFEEIENLEERFNISVHVLVNEPRPVDSDTKATEATEPSSQQVEGPSRTVEPHAEATKLTSLSVDKST